MTNISNTSTPDQSSPQTTGESLSPAQTPWAWYPWVGLAAGVVVLGQLYLQASQGQAAYLFERFWLGMFLFFIPAFWRQLSNRVSRAERLTLLVATALFCYLPKLFRCPTFFCYSDELTWWRGVQDLVGGSPVLSNNPLGQVQGSFPGLPLVTVVLQKASGLSTFQVGLVLIGLVHLLALVAIFLLGEKIFHSSKAGAIAALVYLANADFIYFSSQFSYESLSVPLVILTLLFIQYLLGEPESRVTRAWMIVILVSIAAIVMTHHLSMYMMIVILLGMSLAALILPRRTWLQQSARQLYWVTSFAIIASLGWLAVVGSGVIPYLGEPIVKGFEQITSKAVRQLFGGINLPVYEVISGYLAAVLIGLLALLGAFLIIRYRRAMYAAQAGLLAFGLLYVVTAPLVLTSWGSEAGRRSWTYSFISLALLAGFALTRLARYHFAGKLRIKAPGQWIATLALALLLMGGVASSTSISYRFPGAYLQNSDARSFSPEIIDAAQWMLRQTGSTNRVLGDRTTERIFGSYGLQDPAMLGGPRPWEVFLPTSWTADAQYWLEEANAPFVVVDKRMAEMPPQMDIRFQRGEPPDAYPDQPLPTQSIEKFDNLSQLERIYDSGNIRIYHLNGTIPGATDISHRLAEPAQQNLVDTNEAGGEVNIANALFNLLRSLLLIVLLLILPGIFVGQWLFPNWRDLDLVLRILIAISICIDLIILSTFAFSLLLANVETAATITLALFGIILVIGLAQLALGMYRSRAQQPAVAARTRGILDQARRSDFVLACALSGLGLVAVVFLMGAIHPEANPRTVFALDYSAATPAVQITNYEAGEEVYHLKIHGESNQSLTSPAIHLEVGQSTRLELPPGLAEATQGIIYLDLYVEGEPAPYRSLHFSPGAAPLSSLPELTANQGN